MEDRDKINIYDTKFVKDLFNDMSKTYHRMNYITSFGFSERWRKKFVGELPLESGDIVADLLTGMGECWEYALSKIGPKGKIIALDFSEGMISHAKSRKQKLAAHNIEILCEDVFNSSIADQSVSSVICGFGIKTFSEPQLHFLVIEIRRILKAGGSVSMVDVSTPKNYLLRLSYLFYLKKIIPVLGSIFLGKPETYAMLGIYTERFQNSKKLHAIFEKNGFEVRFLTYFYGCATGIIARKL